MCEVAEITGQIDLHDVRVLLYALSVNFRQPQDPGHAFILDHATEPRIPRRGVVQKVVVPGYTENRQSRAAEGFRVRVSPCFGPRR